MTRLAPHVFCGSGLLLIGYSLWLCSVPLSCAFAGVALSGFGLWLLRTKAKK